MTLHNIPLHEWVGRKIKLNSKDAPGRARNVARIVSFDERAGTAVVHPSKHRGTDVVSISDILPWWSRNDDLRRKYQDLGQDDVADQSADIQQEQRIQQEVASTQAFITTPDDQDIEIEPMKGPMIILPKKSIQVTQMQTASQQPQNDPAARPRAIRRIIVDPNASMTWMEDYKALQDALQGVKDEEIRIEVAKKALEAAKDTVNTFIQALDGSGVQVEWEDEHKPTEARSVITGLSAIDTERVAAFRAALLKKMDPGRKYTRQGILQILGEQETPTTRKILQHTFKNHPTLKRKIGGRGADTTYTIQP